MGFLDWLLGRPKQVTRKDLLKRKESIEKEIIDLRSRIGSQRAVVTGKPKGNKSSKKKSRRTSKKRSKKSSKKRRAKSRKKAGNRRKKRR